jgi:hypothetical protein
VDKVLTSYISMAVLLPVIALATCLVFIDLRRLWRLGLLPWTVWLAISLVLESVLWLSYFLVAK